MLLSFFPSLCRQLPYAFRSGSSYRNIHATNQSYDLIQGSRVFFSFKRQWITQSRATKRHITTNASLQPPWRTMFFGTDEYALQHLKVLNENRKQNDTLVVKRLEVVVPTCKCAVRDYAQSVGLEVHDWSSKSVLEMITSKKFDVGVIVSFGHLIPASIINAFTYGILNVHPSILPRWRGAAPILHTILNGDRETGISIMEIRPINFDVGPLLVQVKFPVPDNCTSLQLRDYLALEGSQLLLSTLRDLRCLEKIEYEQSIEGITHAPKLRIINSRVDWRQTSVEIDRQYRALAEIFGIRTLWNGKSVRLLDMVPLIEMRAEDIERSLTDSYPVDVLSLPTGTVLYCQSRELICIRCQDGWVGYGSIVIKKQMSAKSFYNGYLSKLRHCITVFESQENHLFCQPKNTLVRRISNTAHRFRVIR